MVNDTVLVIIQKLFLFLLFIFFMFYMVRYKEKKSLHITLNTVLLGQFFMLAIELWMWKIEHKETLRFVWFNVFAWCDIAIMYTIYKLHKQNHLALSFAARSAIYGHIALAACQLITYFERAFIQSEPIEYAYRLLIPSITNSVLTVLTFSIAKDIYLSMKESKGEQYVS